MKRAFCSVGDNLVDIYVDHDYMFPGGNALNVAVQVRRLGVDSAYIGAIGNDAPGELIREACIKEELDISRLRVIPGDTAFALVKIINGDRIFLDGCEVGVSDFELDSADISFLSNFNIVHTGDCSNLEDQVPEISEVAKVSFDLSVSSIDKHYEALKKTYLVTASRPDATPTEVENFIREVSLLGPKIVAVTQGELGAYLYVEGQPLLHAKPPKINAIDALGAGDAFIARMLVGLHKKEPYKVLLQESVRWAAKNCETSGGFGYKTRISEMKGTS